MDRRDPLGLSYGRNRYYDAVTGQFTQTDPIGIAGGLNTYGYAGGDPINFSDPFGLCPPIWECMDALISSGLLNNAGLSAIDQHGGPSGVAQVGTLRAGLERSFGGYTFSVAQDTDVRLGLDPSDGSALLAITGEVRITGGEASGLILQGLKIEKGAIDLADGGANAQGAIMLRLLPDPTFEGSGNVTTGRFRVCLEEGRCREFGPGGS